MPQDLLKQNVNIGNVVYSWNFKEYEKFDRGRKWYLVMGLIAAALIFYAVTSGNYLFALIIVLFGIIILLQEMQEPAELAFAITDTGVIVGSKYYPYNDLENFWLVYNPPEVKVLYFQPKSIIKHRLHIPLLDINPEELRNYLNQYLSEDLEQEEEPLSDRLSRLFKMQ
ncbi:MAG: hypothetical protein PHD72_02915 [Patescibacteria group bacterium]|nr:hypothetical protein [Patescibacteria group bacterium]